MREVWHSTIPNHPNCVVQTCLVYAIIKIRLKKLMSYFRNVKAAMNALYRT